MKTSPSLAREPTGRPTVLPECPGAKRPNLSRFIGFSLTLLGTFRPQCAECTDRNACRGGFQTRPYTSRNLRAIAQSCTPFAAPRSIHNFRGYAFLHNFRFFVKNFFHSGDVR